MDADAEPGKGVEEDGWTKDGQQKGKPLAQLYSTATNLILKTATGVYLYF